MGFFYSSQKELKNGIYMSISMNGSDTPVTRPETDNAGLSSRDRKKKKGGGSLSAIEILNTVEKHEWTIKKKKKKKFVCSSLNLK